MKTLHTSNKVSIRENLLELIPGEMLEVPVGLRADAYIRHVASILGRAGRKYSVHVNRETANYEIECLA